MKMIGFDKRTAVGDSRFQYKRPRIETNTRVSAQFKASNWTNGQLLGCVHMAFKSCDWRLHSCITEDTFFHSWLVVIDGVTIIVW